MKLLVTGGCGFIGHAYIRHVLAETEHEVVNVDCLSYAANPEPPGTSPRYTLEVADICEAARMHAIFARHDPDAVVHLAAESHVDRSIDSPAGFVRTNINGTHVILEAATQHYESLPRTRQDQFRFHHISTDEVFGSLGESGRFLESTPYAPRSPYSASKAAADHLVRAWHHTYGLPTLVSNCSNNYGPYQFPEKLIPLMTLAALEGEMLPLYGDGSNVRDWLYVEDHARALLMVLQRGRVGQDYNIGGGCERSNLEVVLALCAILDELAPGAVPHADKIRRVADRPGHDFRYAIDSGKIHGELGWQPRESFDTGLRKTVQWYLDHPEWIEAVRSRGDISARQGLRGASA